MESQLPRPINVKYENKIEIINGQYLKYALLENETTVINQSNFYDYIGITKQHKDYKDYPNSSDANVFYRSKNDKVEIGIPVIEIPAICISIVQMHSETNKYEDQARNAAILLMYLANTGLAQLINEKAENEFNKVIGALKKVPPPKKKK